MNDAAVGAACELAAKIVAGECRQVAGRNAAPHRSSGAPHFRRSRWRRSDRGRCECRRAGDRRREALRQRCASSTAPACGERSSSRAMPASRSTAFERARDRLFADRQAKAIGADRAGEHDRRAAGAVLEFMQRRSALASGRIGVIDARAVPARARRPSVRRRAAASARRCGERLDGEAVIGAC